MALTLGRLLVVGEPKDHPAESRQPRVRARVVSSDVTDAALRITQMMAQADEAIAEKRARFEDELATARATLAREARDQVHSELAAKFIELSSLRQRELERCREDLVQLARLLAERVLRHELGTSQTQLLEFAERCISEVRGATSIVVRVHPDDFQPLKESIEALAETVCAGLKLLPDPELLRGDLHIESDVGTLDARLSTQVACLAEALRESLRT